MSTFDGAGRKHWRRRRTEHGGSPDAESRFDYRLGDRSVAQGHQCLSGSRITNDLEGPDGAEVKKGIISIVQLPAEARHHIGHTKVHLNSRGPLRLHAPGSLDIPERTPPAVRIDHESSAPVHLHRLEAQLDAGSCCASIPKAFARSSEARAVCQTSYWYCGTGQTD